MTPASTGLHPDAISKSLGYGSGTFRAAGAASNLNPSVALTTMLKEGTPQRILWPGARLAPELPRNSLFVDIVTKGLEHLKVVKTVRSWQEPRKRVVFVQGTRRFSMTRHGLESGYDIALPALIDKAFEFALTAALLAKEGVDLDIENEIAGLLGTATNYPSLHRVDETGTEWDAPGGDSKSAYETLYNQIRIAHPGIQRKQFNIFQSDLCHQAALADAAFLAQRVTAQKGDVFPTIEEYQAYLGFGPVWTGDVNVSVDGLTVQSMYGETSIMYVPSEGDGMDIRFGQHTFARLHTMTGGNVYAPYFEDRPTTKWVPYELFALPEAHDLTLGGHVDNMVA